MHPRNNSIHAKNPADESRYELNCTFKAAHLVAYKDIGKGREQGCGSLAYRDIGKGREHDSREEVGREHDSREGGGRAKHDSREGGGRAKQDARAEDARAEDARAEDTEALPIGT